MLCTCELIDFPVSDTFAAHYRAQCPVHGATDMAVRAIREENEYLRHSVDTMRSRLRYERSKTIRDESPPQAGTHTSVERGDD